MLKTTDFRKKPKLRKAWVSFILPECTARLIFSGKKSIFFQPAHKGGNVLPRRCLVRIVFRQQRGNQGGFVGLGLQPLPEERAGIVQRDHHMSPAAAGEKFIGADIILPHPLKALFRIKAKGNCLTLRCQRTFRWAYDS